MAAGGKGDGPLRLEMIERMSALATASLGLVAALAWNDAIQSLFVRVFGTASGIVAKFVYAVLVTAIIVTLTVYLGRASAKVRGQRGK